MTYIGMDTTGMGVGVFPLVRQFFPMVTAILYSPEVKTRLDGKCYEPPISLAGLAKSLHAGVHHSSAIYFKANILTSTFIPGPY